MKLSLDALVLLDTIDRRGSFAGAAAELHRVPSAVSYQVHKLEQDLEVAVFDRRGHRAALTLAGRELLDAGRLLLRAAGELEHRVRRVATGWETELAIAVDALVPIERLWPLVAEFYVHCRDNAAAKASRPRMESWSVSDAARTPASARIPARASGERSPSLKWEWV